MPVLSGIINEQAAPALALVTRFVAELDNLTSVGGPPTFPSEKEAFIAKLKEMHSAVQTTADSIYKKLIPGNYSEADLRRIVGDGDKKQLYVLIQSILGFEAHVRSLALINKDGDKFSGASLNLFREPNKGLEAAAKEFGIWIDGCKARIEETRRLLRAGQ